MSGIKVVQINLGKRQTAASDLMIYAKKNTWDILAIQEGNKLGSFLPGILIRKSPNSRTITCLENSFAKKSKAIMIEELSDNDTVTINLEVINDDKTEQIILINGYCPSQIDGKDNNTVLNENMLKAIKFAEDKQRECVICIDSNAHHPAWGESRLNDRGLNLAADILGHNLFVCNEGDEYTWSSMRGNTMATSIIDVTLCSAGILNSISEWKVVDGIHSDHRAITFNIAKGRRVLGEAYSKISTKWDGFIKDLEGKFGNSETYISDITTLDEFANSFRDKLISAYENNTSIIKIKGSKAEWADREIVDSGNSVRKLKRKLERSIRKNKNVDELRKKVSESENKYRKLCRKKKFENFKSSISKIESVKDVSKLFRALERKDNKKDINSLKKEDGSYTTNREETIELLMKTHFQGCQEIGNASLSPEEEGIIETFEEIEDMTDSQINEFISAKTIRETIMSFGPFKAAGADGIFPALLQKGCDHIIKDLTSMIKASVRLGQAPESWRQSKVIFLPKAGKDNYNTPKAFRPISLSSFLLKTVEKHIDKHMRNSLVGELALDEAQHAYLKGKGTETAVLELITILDREMKPDKKKRTGDALAAFVDIEGAFDNMRFNKIIEAVKKIGVSKNIVAWVYRTLSRREISSIDDASSKKFRPTRGVPQGSCLSPLLWCLILNSLLVRLRTSRQTQAIAYADDLAIVALNLDHKELPVMINKALKIIVAWSEEQGLGVNPAKTELMRFTKKIKPEELPPVKISGTIIPLSEQVRYLGLMLDTKLSMKKHVDHVSSVALKSLWTARSMVTKKGGVTPKSMMLAYRQIIKLRITYLAVAWADKVNTTYNKKLDTLQYRALRLVSGAFHNTLKDSLNVLLYVPPLDLSLKELADRAYLRLKSQNNWDDRRDDISIGKCSKRVKEIIGNRGIDSCFKSIKHGETKFKVIIGEIEEWSNIIEAIKPKFNFFTDGSRIPETGRVASGAVERNSKWEIRIRLNDEATIFQAEMWALLEAAREALRRRPQSENIVFNVDSQAVLKALRKNSINTNTAWKCYSALQTLARGNNVYLNWVKSHNENEGNDAADEAAKRATEQEIAVQIELAPSYISGEIKLKYLNLFTQRWAAKAPRHPWAQVMIGAPDPKIGKALLNLNRTKLRVIIGIKSGMAPLRSIMYKWKLTDSNVCRNCGKHEENIKHWLTECNSLRYKRIEVFGVTVLDNPQVLKSINFFKLLKFAEKTDLIKIFGETYNKEE